MHIKYNKKHIGIVILLLICIFCVAYSCIEEYTEYKNVNRHFDDISIVTSDNKMHKFHMLLANTPELQEKGLGDRVSLDKKDAMLFVFEENEKHYFWMKDMYFPIDMVWLNSDKKVMYIQNDVATSTYPNPFGPNDNSQYVIEYNAGVSDQIHLNIGDTVNF